MASNRNQDERHLHWLRLRRDGTTLRAIAELYGVTDAGVTIATNKIMQADLAESGEPKEKVMKGYWGW